ARAQDRRLLLGEFSLSLFPRRGSVCGRRVEGLPRVRLQLAQGRNLRLEVFQKTFSRLHLLLGLTYSIDESLPCLPCGGCGREFALPRASFLQRFALRRLLLEIAFGGRGVALEIRDSLREQPAGAGGPLGLVAFSLPRGDIVRHSLERVACTPLALPTGRE